MPKELVTRVESGGVRMGTRALRRPHLSSSPTDLPLSSNRQETNCVGSNSASAVTMHMTLGRLLTLSRPWFLICRLALTIVPAL